LGDEVDTYNEDGGFEGGELGLNVGYSGTLMVVSSEYSNLPVLVNTFVPSSTR
jgi:hypothetical protein